MNPKKGFMEMLSGRAIAIAVVVVVSGASFALGFFVGKATIKTQTAKPTAAEIPAQPQEPYQFEEVSPPPIPEALFQSEPTVTARLQEPETKKPEVKPETKPSKPKTKTKKTASIAKKETYSVQAGAFFNSKDAETLKAKLRKKGYTVYIQSTKTPEGKTIYRVRVGKFKDKKAAELLALRLKKTEGIDAFVIKRK